MKFEMAQERHRFVIALLAVALLALITLGVAYLAGFLFLLASRADPREAGVLSILDYWHWYAGDPVLAPRLRGSMGIAALLGYVIAPALAASGMRRRRSLHGDARFASAREVRRSGLLAPQAPRTPKAPPASACGILLGRWGKRYLSLAGQEFVMLSAPTRSGKGVSIVIPNLLNWADSVVVVDIKRENFEITAGYRARHGQAVHLFAPFDEQGRSARFNPLSYVREDPFHRVGDILAIATTLYPTDARSAGTADAFFNDQARNLFLALALLLVETPQLPRTIGEMVRQASGKRKAIREHLAEIVHHRAPCNGDGEEGEPPLSEACVDAIMRFTANSENTLASVLASFNAPLTIFADAHVDAATSGDDFWLTDLRKRRMSVYLHVPPNRLAQGSLLLNLFFSILLDQNTRELPGQNPSLRHTCLLVLDEFPALGRIAVLEKGVGFIAGYGLRLVTITQSNAMVAATYGRELARNLATNHVARVFFAPQELEDAREYSEMLGYQTERRESRSQSHAAGRGASSSVNHSEERRALMLPQELREMDADQQIILLQGCKPILARKIRYYRDPAFRARVLPPPEVPKIDMEVFQANINGRMRPATAENHGGGGPTSPPRSDDAQPPHALANGEDIAEQVDKFFDSLQLDMPLPTQLEGDENDDESAHAGRGRSADRDLFER